MKIIAIATKGILTLTAASLLLMSPTLAADKEPKMKKQQKQAECTDKGPVIMNADGKDGTDNNGPDSGKGAKGGKVKVPCNAKGTFSANGGNGGNKNSGGKSGNGGAGGSISF